MAKLIELHLRTGRPLGNDSWVKSLEKRLGRKLAEGEETGKGQLKDCDTIAS